MSDSIFTKIIKGEIPCYKIAEDDDNFSFLDINPNRKGHTLCVPKQQVDKLFDLNTETYQSLMLFSKKIANAIEKALPCNRVGMAVVGLEVPHAHIHLIPIDSIKDISFQEKESVLKENFIHIAADIKQYLG